MGFDSQTIMNVCSLLYTYVLWRGLKFPSFNFQPRRYVAHCKYLPIIIVYSYLKKANVSSVPSRNDLNTTTDMSDSVRADN